MPLVDSNLAALWDGGASSLYRAALPDGSAVVGYTRAARQQYTGNDADALVAALVSKGLVRGQRIALIGAGFGWVAERMLELGYGPTAVDTSTWIQANKAGNAATTIISADVNGSTGRRTIRQQFGSNTADVDWAVSEDVLPLLVGTGPTPGGANEIVPFCTALRALCPNVAHWVTTLTTPGAQDPRLNWKTLEEWKAWCSPDWVIARNEFSRVL